MKPHHQPLGFDSVDTWNEELARAKKFKEAMQKRAAEKKRHRENEKPDEDFATGTVDEAGSRLYGSRAQN